jgi:hypothetical protein
MTSFEEEGSADDAGDFYEIEVEDSSDITFTPDSPTVSVAVLPSAVAYCEVYLPRVSFSLLGRSPVELTLPTSILPDQFASLEWLRSQLCSSGADVHSFKRVIVH